jgi:hypothetical protein
MQKLQFTSYSES